MSIIEILGVMYKIYKNRVMNCGFVCLIGKYEWVVCENCVLSEIILYLKGFFIIIKKIKWCCLV